MSLFTSFHSPSLFPFPISIFYYYFSLSLPLSPVIELSRPKSSTYEGEED